jgi:hypothetical protein
VIIEAAEPMRRKSEMLESHVKPVEQSISARGQSAGVVHVIATVCQDRHGYPQSDSN